MGQPFVGEIRMFAGSFAPAGWDFCNGQLIAIAENDTLFALIGTTYGGDGQATFGLPNLQSRVPIHQGTGPNGITRILGESGGTETETITVQQTPTHTHTPAASATGGSDTPAGNYWANTSTGKPYAAPGGVYVAMNTTTIAPAGGSQPHDNMIPFLTVSYIISLFGVFPSNQ